MTKLTEMDKSLKELKTKYNNCIENKDLQIGTLKLDVEKLQTSLQNEYEKVLVIENEKTLLVQELDQMKANKNNLEKEYLNKCAVFNCITAQLNDDIVKKTEEINTLKQEVEMMSKNNADKLKGK